MEIAVFSCAMAFVTLLRIYFQFFHKPKTLLSVTRRVTEDATFASIATLIFSRLSCIRRKTGRRVSE